MPWRPSFDLPLPADPALDAFRDTIARLTSDGRPVGYLAFRVTHFRSSSGGHLWWRRWGLPVEAVEWMQEMTDAEPADSGNLCEGVIVDPRDDAWLRNVLDGETEEFRQDVAHRVYTVRWLTGPERDCAWAQHGFVADR